METAKDSITWCRSGRNKYISMYIYITKPCTYMSHGESEHGHGRCWWWTMVILLRLLLLLLLHVSTYCCVADEHANTAETDCLNLKP